jgi:hypothetical protein
LAEPFRMGKAEVRGMAFEVIEGDSGGVDFAGIST